MIAGVAFVAFVRPLLSLDEALENILYGLRPDDTVSLIVGVGAVMVVAVLAGYFPARRASRIDPVSALRHE